MRQLIKFCLVGFSSTVINQVILALLLRMVPAMPWWIAVTVGFVFGVTNGFYWNQRWTFASQTARETSKQFPKFILTNVIALGLNLAITKGFLILFTGKLAFGTNPHPNTIQLASICAIPIVVIWTFSAARFWTFRAPSHQASTLPVPPIASPD